MGKVSGVRNSKSSRAWILAVVVFAIIIVSLWAVVMQYKWENSTRVDTQKIEMKKDDNLVAAAVNGEPVYVRELRLRMAHNRASIYSYFSQKYGVQDSADFWTTGHNGEVPVELDRKQSLDELIKIKVKQILAKQKGLMQDISYLTFIEEFKKENKRRKEAVDSNQVIYGPVQYAEDGYFDYITSNMEIKLKEKLAEKETAPTDEEIRVYYEANKDKFKKGDSVKLQKISISFVDDKGNVSNIMKQEAKAGIEEAKARLDRGEKLEDVAMLYNKDGKVIEEIYDDKARRREAKYNMFKKSSAGSQGSQVTAMAVGQVSGIVERNNAYEIIKCVEKKSGQYAAFDEAKGGITLRLRDEKYETYIEKRLKDAKVNIINDIYNNVMVD